MELGTESESVPRSMHSLVLMILIAFEGHISYRKPF